MKTLQKKKHDINKNDDWAENVADTGYMLLKWAQVLWHTYQVSLTTGSGIQKLLRGHILTDRDSREIKQAYSFFFFSK